MNEHETYNAVRAWLNTLPGTIQDGCSQGVMRMAWALFGRGNLEMFRRALEMNGFKPEPLGRTFILRLPSKSIAGDGAERQRRLHHITG